MFSPRSLPSNPISLPLDENEDEPSPPSRRRWSKRKVRFCVDLFHILTLALLLAGVIVAFISIVNTAWALAMFWFIYLLPPITGTLLLEVFHLWRGYTPVWVAKKLGRLLRLGARAILYMMLAALVMSFASLWLPGCYYCNSGGRALAVLILGGIALGFGLILLILASVAHRCGFMEWVEEPVGKEEEDSLPDFVGSLPGGEETTGAKGP